MSEFPHILDNTAAHADMQSEHTMRFTRPSSLAPYPLRFSASQSGEAPVLKEPIEAVEAYFSRIQDTEELSEAYTLLSRKNRLAQSKESFFESFTNVQHVTLLQLLPAYDSPDKPETLRSFFIEAEILMAAPAYCFPNTFAYAYGIITVCSENDTWRIDSLSLAAEKFLCTPSRDRLCDASASVPIVYRDYYHLIDTVGAVRRSGVQTEVFAESAFEDYRFLFTRLTNGCDILLHEYRRDCGEWAEVHLLDEAFARYKCTYETLCTTP